MPDASSKGAHTTNCLPLGADTRQCGRSKSVLKRHLTRPERRTSRQLARSDVQTWATKREPTRHWTATIVWGRRGHSLATTVATDPTMGTARTQQRPAPGHQPRRISTRRIQGSVRQNVARINRDPHGMLRARWPRTLYYDWKDSFC